MTTNGTTSYGEKGNEGEESASLRVKVAKKSIYLIGSVYDEQSWKVKGIMMKFDERHEQSCGGIF